MDKQDGLFSYTEIMFRKQKEQTADIHGYILQKSCGVKEVRDKVVHTLWSHLYKDLRQSNLIYDD